MLFAALAVTVVLNVILLHRSVLSLERTSFAPARCAPRDDAITVLDRRLGPGRAAGRRRAARDAAARAPPAAAKPRDAACPGVGDGAWRYWRNARRRTRRTARRGPRRRRGAALRELRARPRRVEQRAHGVRDGRGLRARDGPHARAAAVAAAVPAQAGGRRREPRRAVRDRVVRAGRGLRGPAHRLDGRVRAARDADATGLLRAPRARPRRARAPTCRAPSGATARSRPPRARRASPWGPRAPRPTRPTRRRGRRGAAVPDAAELVGRAAAATGSPRRALHRAARGRRRARARRRRLPAVGPEPRGRRARCRGRRG